MGSTSRRWTIASVTSFATLALLITAACADEESPPPPRRAANSLREGAHAFQFQFSDWALRSLQGSTLAYKWHFTDQSAWRVGVSVGVDFEDRHDRVTNLSDSLLAVANRDFDAQSIGLSWHYLHYPGHPGRLTPLFETGPSVAWNHTKEPGTASHTWNFGWSAAVGAEWFATHNLSVMSQYGLSLAYLFQHADQRSGNSHDVIEDNRYRLDSLPITVGLSMYFF